MREILIINKKANKAIDWPNNFIINNLKLFLLSIRIAGLRWETVKAITVMFFKQTNKDLNKLLIKLQLNNISNKNNLMLINDNQHNHTIVGILNKIRMPLCILHQLTNQGCNKEEK